MSATRSLITTLLVAGGLVTAAARYSTAPAPTMEAGETAHGKKTSAEATREKQSSSSIEEPAAAAHDEGAAEAATALHDQLCAAIVSQDRQCPLDDNIPAAGMTRGPATKPPATEAVIAIFPDPIHTHLSLRFDRNVDALIAAAQDAGWYFDRQWLPWTCLGAGMIAGMPAEPGGDKDLPDLVKSRTYRSGFESVPGFISFRPIPGKQDHTLVVFIVGDSPISGILPAQFRTAYKDTALLQPAVPALPGSRAGPQRELRILGPSFTGSIDSLGTLLSSSGRLETTPPFSAIRIISPTISRDLSTVTLTGESGPVRPRPRFVSYGMSLNCRIRSVAEFVNRQTRLDTERIDPGEPHLGQQARIALLSEDESAYGRVANQTGHESGECDLSKTDLLRLTFPRDISHLRSAYQKKSIWGFGASSTGGTSLGLDFADPHEELDAVPNFSAGQNAASLETSVRQLAETLTERDIRVVLLSATDVFDELFLARMLSRLAPNLSVVILDSDALFLHQGGGDTYNHVFVATPFPSLPQNLFWSAPANLLDGDGCNPRIFPSEAAEGSYLAAGSLLLDLPGNDRPGNEVLFARRQFCTTQYTSPFEPTARPPLWVLAIEHGHQWPIATLDLENQAPANVPSIEWPKGKDYESITGLLRHHIPVTLWLGLFALLALAVAHVYGSTAVTIRSTILWDYAISDAATLRVRVTLQLALTLIAIVAIRFLLPPDLARLVHHFTSFSILTQFSILALAALAALQAACLVAGASPSEILPRVLSSPRNAQLFSRVALIVGFFTGAAFSALSLLPWGLLKLIPGARVEFFERYRALYPFSGIAPTLPILLLLCALALAVFSRLGRLYFSGPWRPILPANTTPADLLHNQRLPSEASVAPLRIFLADWDYSVLVATGGNKVASLFYRIAGRPYSLGLLVAVVLLLGRASLSWAAPVTLDGHPYTVMLKGLSAAIIASLCFDLLRAWRLWRLLRALVLRPLERTPLRRGFDRIKGMSWERIWRTMDSSPLFSYHPARRAIELATGDPARLGLPATGNATLSARWQKLTVEQVATLVAEGWGLVLASLAGLAEAVLPAMVDAWNHEAGGVTAKDDVISERDKDLVKPATGFIADALPAQEEFVALVYLQYVRIVLIQIRHSLFSAAASYVFLTAALTQYPLVGRHAVEIGLLLLFAFLATVAITVYAAIHRDSILSRTTSSEPGKLDWDFYLKIAGYLGLPLIGLLVSQFPELSGTIISWLPGSGAGK